MKKETRAWVRKAEQDWAAAVREASADDPPRDVACFLCQQCAEKYLKAILEELGLSIPKTHDLDKLLTHLLPHHNSLKGLTSRLVILSRYAVDYRYPGFSTSTREMRAAIRHAGRVRLRARTILGLPP
jgi:HEPN domain-containing protein